MTHILDVEGLSIRAESFRGQSAKDIGQVLVRRARNAGVRDSSFWGAYERNGNFWATCRDQFSQDPTTKFRLGTAGDLLLRTGDPKRDRQEQVAAELQVIGILAHMEGVEVTCGIERDQSVQVASGLHRGSEVGIVFRADIDESSSVVALGYNRFVHPTLING